MSETAAPTDNGSPVLAAHAAQERAYFDQFVREQGEFNPFAERGWRTLTRRYQQWVAPQRPVDVLDIGCGTGQSRQIFLQQAARYVGLDLSATAIAVAGSRFRDSEWVTGDACALPFRAESFDVVGFSSVLHHIPNFAAAVAEGVRVLRPGGWVFAFDPNLLHPAMAIFRHPKSPFHFREGVSPNERPLTPWSLRRAFEAAQLVHLRQRGQSDIPYRYVAPRRLKPALRFYNLCDWVWEHLGLGRWFGTFVVTCGQKPDGRHAGDGSANGVACE
jgi:ubiquinone/menaquinone biosynthesis C-methylase UbiE